MQALCIFEYEWKPAYWKDNILLVSRFLLFMFVLWRSYYLSCLYLFHLNVFASTFIHIIYAVHVNQYVNRKNTNKICWIHKAKILRRKLSTVIMIFLGNFSDNDWRCFQWHKITDEGGDKIGDIIFGSSICSKYICFF